MRTNKAMVVAAALGALAGMGGNLQPIAAVTDQGISQAGQQAKKAPADRQQQRSTNAANLFGVVSGGGWGGPYAPTYRNRYPVSAAQAKRNAIKRRNKLRAKGQHRKAVR